MANAIVDNNRDVFLRAAEHCLSIALQPIYCINSGRVFGYEALTRDWETLGFDGPYALFDAAARIGALSDLELRQTERAIEALGIFDEDERPKLFANIDIRILEGDAEYFDRLNALLERTGFRREDLCLELSERHEKQNPEALRGRIESLRERGFRFALDDFGVGGSDVLALYHFDVSVLKIDRFLIDGLANDARKRVFVARIVELAHLLGQDVIAEGVETEEDLVACRELGCDQAQGYHLGRARPEPDAAPREVPALSTEPVDRLAEAAQRLPAFRAETSVDAIVDALRKAGPKSLFPVVDDAERPLGLISMAMIDARRAAASDMAETVVKDVLAPCPVLELTATPERLAEILANAEPQGVILTSGRRYFGFVPAPRLNALGLPH